MIAFRQQFCIEDKNVEELIKRNEQIGSEVVSVVNENFTSLQATFIADDLGIVIYVRGKGEDIVDFCLFDVAIKKMQERIYKYTTPSILQIML